MSRHSEQLSWGRWRLRRLDFSISGGGIGGAAAEGSCDGEFGPMNVRMWSVC